MIGARLAGIGCRTHGREILADPAHHGWVLAYALAWLSVSGGNSVMPPWVRHQFPEAGRLVRTLRDTACTDPECGWCREHHDARRELSRWFGFHDFRPEPEDPDTRQPMQRSIVEAAMAGEHVLAILPTGTGKSLCYQIPALSRYDKTGALTVVISPLVALMADQVAGLEAHGIGACIAINALLSLPERADALDRVRLGDAGILIISPEQLRNRSLRRVLDQREIGAWVLDEAHCLSKWGHDFRPDYRYVGRFIRKKAEQDSIPPVLCLTATAKPDVIADIVAHFRDELGVELKVFDGGAQRTNLEFVVVPTTGGEKFAHLHQILMADLPPDAHGSGGSCAASPSTAAAKAGGGGRSLRVRKSDAETVQVTVQREWTALEETASRRRAGAYRLLEHLLDCLPPGSRGTDLLAETTLGRLLGVLQDDLELKSRVKHPEKLLERALLWLHEQDVIRLHKGLAVFRPAMTIKLAQDTPRRGFVRRTHRGAGSRVRTSNLSSSTTRDRCCRSTWMVEYARRGLDAMADALRLAMDYFSMKQGDFLHRWLPDRDREIERQTTPESWRAIVESLNNPAQQRIVADDREATNVLVLGRSRLRQDAGAGTSHRLSRARQTRESPAASWPWPTTGTRRSRSGAALPI